MEDLITLDTNHPIWSRFFTVAPLVLIGTRDESQEYNLAPKHMAMPMGWDNYFGFVCTDTHTTYHNIKREGVFTVTYPRPTQVVLASLTATRRDDDNFKPALLSLPIFRAVQIDGPLVRDGYVYLECMLDKIIDGFGSNSLITGKIVAARVHPDAIRESEQDNGELLVEMPLLAYLEPGRFARISETFSFPFPRNYKR